jgi:hypothetical protein
MKAFVNSKLEGFKAANKRNEDKKQLECAFNGLNNFKGLNDFKIIEDLKNPFVKPKDDWLVKSSPYGYFDAILKYSVKKNTEEDNGVKYILYKKYTNTDYVKKCNICSSNIEKNETYYFGQNTNCPEGGCYYYLCLFCVKEIISVNPNLTSSSTTAISGFSRYSRRKTSKRKSSKRSKYKRQSSKRKSSRRSKSKRQSSKRSKSKRKSSKRK